MLIFTAMLGVGLTLAFPPLGLAILGISLIVAGSKSRSTN
jgi:hypothetical protein